MPKKPGKRKSSSSGRRKPKAKFNVAYRRMKRKWLTRENALYVLGLEKKAEKLKQRFSSLDSFDAKFITELYTALTSILQVKRILAEKGMTSLDDFAKEFLSWFKRMSKLAFIKTSTSFREEAFITHLEKKLGRAFRKAGVSAHVFQERKEKPSITGQTYIDAKVNLELFQRFEEEEGKRRMGEISPLWQKKAVNYFIERLREFLSGFPQKSLRHTVRETRVFVDAATNAKIEDLQITIERLEKELEGKRSRKAIDKLKKELALRQRFRAYLIQLVGEEAKRLGLKWSKD